MREDVPYKSRETVGELRKAVAEKAVTVIARPGCCMTHMARGMLLSMGVNPAIYEVEDAEERSIAEQLKAVQLSAVFIGGKLVGGLERIVTTQLTRELELTPLLK